MAFEFTLDENLTAIELVGRKPLRVRIDGQLHELHESPASPDRFSVVVDGTTHEGFRYRTPDRVWIRLAGRTFVSARADVAFAHGRGGDGKDEIRADMPGTIVTLHVQVGQAVAAGDPVLTLESMKLQITVASDREATIASLPVAEGATFERGAVLVGLASAASDASAGPVPTEKS